MALKGAKTVVDMIPGLAGSLDGATATVQGFNQGLMDSIDSNLGAAADNFSSMLGDSGKRAGQDIAQPLTNAVRGWRDQARLNAQKQDDAANRKRPEPAEEAKKLQVTGVTEALKAIDSRSKEGVAEMFRLMRGSPDSAAQRTANASERTADATEKWLDTQDDVEFAIP
jgi:hypothetical protein